MATIIDDFVVNGKAIKDWTIKDHNEALDTLGAHIYKPFHGVLVLGGGSKPYLLKVRKETKDGEVETEMVDGLACYSAVPFGHRDPVIVEGVTQFVAQMATIPRSISHSFLGPWLVKLKEFTEMDMFLPKSGGTEANEAAIKLIKKWGKNFGGKNGKGIKGIPVIISAKNAFHGRGLGSTALMDDPTSRKDLEPLMAGVEHVPFNDINALEEKFKEHDGDIAGVFLEPIQAEAGIIVPDDNYLRDVQKLAKKNNALFGLDEIQTGFGRTGANFAWQLYGLEQPDLMTTGKAMSSGVLPISCLCGKKALMELFEPHGEGSTFGGYPLASFVGLLTIRELEKRNISRLAAENGEYLQNKLREVAKKYPTKVKEVRGKGMLIGVEIFPQYDGHKLSMGMLDNGVYAKETHDTNLRIAPPIVIDREGMDKIASALDASLAVL
ncbi:MAG: aminotransferase class III-fold pyridoxal phosphate-dependent enzyme [Anaerolineales bacterium]|nr:aminotransferase class III-fold pyridoxal phosphate-dependent enzyme [Anaerolineales bacterium]